MSKLFAALSVLLIASAGQAAPLRFATVLSGPAEFPSVSSPGTGTASVVYDPDTHLLRLDVVFSDLVSPTTVAHIHCCVSPDAPTPTAGVATTVPSFPGFPVGVTFGTYSMTFDLTLATSFNPTFIANNGGTVAGAEAALIAGLIAGEAYLNIHTMMFPAGEIRGFFVQLADAPAPSLSSLGLGVLAGLLAFAGVRRARRAHHQGTGL